MAQVKIGPEFFEKAKNDYSDWKWALVREFFQNCIDCGSTLTTFDVVYERDGDNTVLTVENNGSPMDEDILVDKLLSLGSSGKDFKDSVGGFGKAKELLYLCWAHYQIESGNLKVEGVGAEYTIKKVRREVKGTRSTILIPGDYKSELEGHARFFISVSNVQCRFKVNGDPVDAKMRRGYYRRDLSFGKVYTNKQLENSIVVRIGGTPMFTEYTAYKGCVVVELDGVSSDVLTSNRDGLRWEQRYELRSFVEDLGTNKRRALKQVTTEYFRFEGDKIKCEKGEKVTPKTNLGCIEGDDDAKLEAAAIAAAESGEQIAKMSPAALRAAGYSDEEIIEHERARASAIASAFIIKNETGRKVPKSWRPDNEDFSAYAWRLAMVWSRLLVLMHRIFDVEDEFTIGFIFSNDTIAQHELTGEHGRVYYINPVKVEDGKWKKRFNYAAGTAQGKVDLNQLAITALHELVHGLGYNDHDEDYAYKLTDMAGTLLCYQRELKQCYDCNRSQIEKERKGE